MHRNAAVQLDADGKTIKFNLRIYKRVGKWI